MGRSGRAERPKGRKSGSLGAENTTMHQKSLMRSDSLMQRKCIVEVKPFSNCVRYSQIKGFGAFRIVNLYLYVTGLQLFHGTSKSVPWNKRFVFVP